MYLHTCKIAVLFKKKEISLKLCSIHQPLSLSQAHTTFGSQVPGHSTASSWESFTQGLTAAVEHPLCPIPNIYIHLQRKIHNQAWHEA